MILTIDFEASCLPRHGRSFPIEVGIAGPGFVRSWLVRPHVLWAGWDWTGQAEELHGLSRATIEREGYAADYVLACLAEIAEGCRVVADSLIDQHWLETLAQAAGRGPPFAIDHVSLLLDERGISEERIAFAAGQADSLCPARHRAGADAQWLQTLVAQALPGAAEPSKIRIHV